MIENELNPIMELSLNVRFIIKDDDVCICKKCNSMVPNKYDYSIGEISDKQQSGLSSIIKKYEPVLEPYVTILTLLIRELDIIDANDLTDLMEDVQRQYKILSKQSETNTDKMNAVNLVNNAIQDINKLMQSKIPLSTVVINVLNA